MFMPIVDAALAPLAGPEALIAGEGPRPRSSMARSFVVESDRRDPDLPRRSVAPVCHAGLLSAGRPLPGERRRRPPPSS